ncbi:MAG: Gfo/Idh/MocA family oxidoreductase [Verrucomicrobiaceae bacterium]|nr:Gfo/Idh/MocA family oxidoreductase [Verrucomicrobiaceae bacterium]
MHRRTLLTALAAAPLTSFAAETKLRVAIIGHTGRGNYGHGLDTMWKAIPATEIVAIADADAKGLETELKKIGTGKGFADYHAMLAEVKPDIVAIGARHIDQHRDMMLAAIQNGAKGIYIEKPFVRSPAEADEVIAAAEKTGTKVAIAHRNRYHPVMSTITRLIEAGEIGRVLEMRGRGKEDTRGGSLDLWVLGSHLFNLATLFGGEPTACTAGVYQDGKPITKAQVKEGDEGIGALAGNEVHARFELAQGIPLFFDSVQNAGVKEAGFGLQIIGTKGVIDFRIDQEPVAHLRPGSPFQPNLKASPWLPITTAGIGKPEPIANLGKKLSSHETAGLDLIAAIHENRAPLCDAVQGRQTIEMICAVFESHRLNGQRVPLPLKTRVNPLTLL